MSANLICDVGNRNSSSQFSSIIWPYWISPEIGRAIYIHRVPWYTKHLFIYGNDVRLERIRGMIARRKSIKKIDQYYSSGCWEYKTMKRNEKYNQLELGNLHYVEEITLSNLRWTEEKVMEDLKKLCLMKRLRKLTIVMDAGSTTKLNSELNSELLTFIVPILSTSSVKDLTISCSTDKSERLPALDIDIILSSYMVKLEKLTCAET
jgi:hypothetical protein